MPQPLSRVLPSATIILGNAGDRPLARHADLAVLAIEAIASWSNVEAFMLRLFMQLLGGNESLAGSVFLALKNQSSKTDAINAAAVVALTARPTELSILRAILKIAKSNEKERNKLAHWTWGDSPNIPDAVLLVDPRAGLDELDRSEIYVYRAPDFQSIVRANDRLCGFGLTLRWIIGYHVANRDGHLLKELEAEPEIKEQLARQSAQ